MTVVYISGVLAHLVRKTYHFYMHSDPDSACTENAFGLHALGPRLCMYGKRVWPTYTRTPILLVRKTCSAYIYSDPNSARTQNTLYGKVRPKWNQGSQGHSRASRGRPIQFAGLGRTGGLCPRFNYFYPKFSPLEIYSGLRDISMLGVYRCWVYRS